jgi:hypothetical protein
MVKAAEHHQVIQARLTAVGPMMNVMGIDILRFVAAGVLADTVPLPQCSPDGCGHNA